ncbi:MAG TPA: hypothetical protein P5531_10205 [Bacteroidales bacterium]|nr:hypothetical protein [Bacteroidales bacterium]HSA44011.1 hypothetical protein [Bacteroidales bacterium]
MKQAYIMAVMTFYLLFSCSGKSEQEGSEQHTTSGKKEGNTLILQKTTEARERAFTFLLPKGWIVEGGILRVDPNAAGGPAQAIEAKVDMTISKDPQRRVMTRWLPDLFYIDMSGQPAAGMFPIGSTNNGMIVMPKMNASSYLQRVVFPYLHPSATEVKILEEKPAPGLVDIMRREDWVIQIPLQYDAASLLVQYAENGVTYKEAMVSGIMDFGMYGAGTWKNRHCFVYRAPAAEFDQWRGPFSLILNSVRLNPEWVKREIQFQISAGRFVVQTQAELQRIEQEIHNSHQRTNSEIMNDAYLNLTGKEEYVNPFTRETEIGTNEYNYRWQNEQGDIIYTDNMNYNPNQDPSLQVQGFQKSQPRKR